MPALPIIWAFLKRLPWAWIGGALALVGVILWVRGMESQIDKQATQITDLKSDLVNEQVARVRDVAGLTALSSGLLAASSAKTKDQEALSNAIDVQHPQPVSSGLASLLGCLRATDAGKQCVNTAPGTGGKPAPATASAH